VGTVEFSREGVASDERFSFEALAVNRGAALQADAPDGLGRR